MALGAATAASAAALRAAGHGLLAGVALGDSSSGLQCGGQPGAGFLRYAGALHVSHARAQGAWHSARR